MSRKPITLAGGVVYDRAKAQIEKIKESFATKPIPAKEVPKIERAKAIRQGYRADAGIAPKPAAPLRSDVVEALYSEDIQFPSRTAYPMDETFDLLDAKQFGVGLGDGLVDMLESATRVRRRRASLGAQRLPTRPQDRPRQLGEPNRDRAAKSKAGFDVDQLAIGHDKEGGVIRSRERAMLTPLALLQERVAMEILEMQKKGQDIPAYIRVSQTPSDEIIAHNPRVVHDYINTHIEVVSRSIKGANYEGSVSGGEPERIPLQDHEWKAWAFYAWVQKNAYLAVVTLMNQVVEQCFAERIAHASNRPIEDMITKADIGRYWARKHKSDRDAVLVADGALAVVSQILTELHLDYDMLTQRKKRLDKIEMDNRKKISYG